MISRWCCLSRIAAKKACASSGVVKGAHVTVNQPRMVRRYLYGMVWYHTDAPLLQKSRLVHLQSLSLSRWLLASCFCRKISNSLATSLP